MLLFFRGLLFSCLGVGPGGAAFRGCGFSFVWVFVSLSVPVRVLPFGGFVLLLLLGAGFGAFGSLGWPTVVSVAFWALGSSSADAGPPSFCSAVLSLAFLAFRGRRVTRGRTAHGAMSCRGASPVFSSGFAGCRSFGAAVLPRLPVRFPLRSVHSQPWGSGALVSPGGCSSCLGSVSSGCVLPPFLFLAVGSPRAVCTVPLSPPRSAVASRAPPAGGRAGPRLFAGAASPACRASPRLSVLPGLSAAARPARCVGRPVWRRFLSSAGRRCPRWCGRLLRRPAGPPLAFAASLSFLSPLRPPPPRETAGPTRNPDASGSEDSRAGSGTRGVRSRT